ncbi:MAG: AraC family transcriptional regulator [Cytophagaceae bacterium]|jgi:AraC-like DNA-binding protein|nr:AraC family transcriptional regulator [Cytophagaceae bacterium]
MLEIINKLIFALPFGMYTTFGVLTLVATIVKVHAIDLMLRRILGVYFICAVITGGLLPVYYFDGEMFERFSTVYFGAMLLNRVMWYRFARYATLSGKRFSRLHYILPLFISCILLAVQHLSGIGAADFQTLMFTIFLLLAAVYLMLLLREIHKFHIRQVLKYLTVHSADRYRIALYLCETVMFTVVFGAFPFFGGQHPEIVISVAMSLFILLALALDIPLTYTIIHHYMITGKAMSLFHFSVQVCSETVAESSSSEKRAETLPDDARLVEPDNPAHCNHPRKRPDTKECRRINKAIFEEYFRKKKPYLNHNLTIIDLAELLQTNRTYLSGYINRTYGINFCSYVNRCRLHELERLMAAPGNRGKTPSELYFQAGFSDYVGYIRAKRRENL